MCLLLVSYKTHPKYKMIIAANRDEFYNRPASSADFWSDEPAILAGRDLKAGGTWLGITRKGRFAAITNYRDPKSMKTNAPSRGELVINFLTGNNSLSEFSKELLSSSDLYNGYNLLYADKESIRYFSNQTKKQLVLSPGIYGLSNHLLDTPWPKVEKSKKSFKNILNKEFISTENLFDILSDSSIPSDELLPDTGLGLEIERAVSPIFVKTPQYGTRSSTAILIDYDDNVIFTEKSLNDDLKEWSTKSFQFKLI